MSSPVDKPFLAALRRGACPQESAERGGATLAAIKQLRRRDLSFAVACDKAVAGARGVKRSRLEVFTDVAWAHLSPAERRQLAERVAVWRGALPELPTPGGTRGGHRGTGAPRLRTWILRVTCRTTYARAREAEGDSR